MARRVTDEEKKYLLSLKPEDITYELGMKLFSDTVKKGPDNKIEIFKAHYDTTDLIKLDKNEFMNSEPIETTLGLFLFNKFITEPLFKEHIGFYNKTLNADAIDDYEALLSQLLLVDKINTKQMADYLNRIQWFGMRFHESMAASFTMKTMKPIDSVIKLRDKLIKENKDEIEKGNVLKMAEIEKETVKLAMKELGNDPGMDLYKSGARGSVGNNYKQLSVVKGIIMDQTDGKQKMMTSNFYEGVKKDELSFFATNVTNGAYPKACMTAVSGYKSKQINAAYQSVVLRKDVDDCGSVGYIEILMTKSLSKLMLYRVIIDGSKLVTLTPDVIESYIGKNVKLRSILYCGCDYGCCRTCAGKMYEQLGLTNMGMTLSTFTGALLNKRMKSFHDTSVKLAHLDITDLTF